MINEIFSYKDGVLYWAKPSRNDLAGKPAGHIKEPTKRNPKGSVEVRVFGRNYAAHRLIWEMHNGPIPALFEVDHIDGNPLNNKIENLRLADLFQNRANIGLTKRNTSGFKGVSKMGNRWRADFRSKGKCCILGFLGR